MLVLQRAGGLSGKARRVLFQWSTRLADGLGLKETAPSFIRRAAPQGLVPPLLLARSRIRPASL